MGNVDSTLGERPSTKSDRLMPREETAQEIRKKRSGLICVVFLLAFFIGASASEAVYKVCISDSCCQQCDYYDAHYNYLYTIYWCWTRCPQ
jgi:hypothetical protein